MNSNICDLLGEIGVYEKPAEEKTSPKLDSNPQFDGDGKMYFTREQIDMFGKPNYPSYYVVEEREVLFGMEWEDELQLPRPRKVHRYNRSTRFRHILTQLCCMTGNVPIEVVAKVADELGVKYKIWERWQRRKDGSRKIKEWELLEKYDYDPDDIWDRVRIFLRDNKLGLYYNRIPTILNHFGIRTKKNITPKQYTGIIEEFQQLSDAWISSKKIYFPDLRYVALRLMNKHGIDVCYRIPWVNTKRKLKSLHEKVERIYDTARRNNNDKSEGEVDSEDL